MQLGAEEVDDRVERSLYQRAVGYKTESVKIFMPAGAKEPVYATFIENVQPDVRAAEIWLRNRRRDRWTQGDGNQPTTVNITFAPGDDAAL